jgi:hypothetical protein
VTVRRNLPLLTFAAMTLLILDGTIALWQPRLALHDEDLTIIRTSIGELDVNHPPGHRGTIWWQEPGQGVNVRLLVLP